jgi:hypothetical protein
MRPGAWEGGVLFCVIVLASSGCAAARPAQPPPPPYEPRFSYKVEAEVQNKVDVTVGVVAPQFSGDGTAYWAQQKNDDIARGMIRGLRTEIGALLIAKGLNTTGPFDSVDNMTFPEKKSADLVLYPEFDFEAGFRVSNIRNEQRTSLLTGTELVLVCDIAVAPAGAISLIVREPMSGEKVWLKKVEVSVRPQRFQGLGRTCTGQAVSQEVRDAWAKAHEQVFQGLMKDLDRYVNGEEFQSLKKQSLELRAKKVY